MAMQAGLNKYILQTKRNYNIARVYYEQKQNLFIQYWLTKYEIDIGEELSIIVNKAVPIWEREVNKALEAADSKAEQVQVLQNFIETYSLPPRKNLAKKLISTEAGLIWEDFIVKIGATKQVANIYGQNVSSILQILGSGDFKSTSTVVKGFKNIRNDIVISDITINSKDLDDKRLFFKKGNEKQYFELDTDVILGEDIKYNKNDSNQLNNILSNGVLGAYLQDNSLLNGVGGLNLKSWTGEGHGKRFSDSSIVQKNLANRLKQANNGKGILSVGYAYAIDFHFISQRLINIISPTTVGFLSGSDLIWTSQVLENYFLYMTLSTSKDKEIDLDFNNTQEWHKWKISNSTLYLYNQANKKINTIQYKIQKELQQEKLTIKGRVSTE